jgi:hypothetical protein
MNIHTALERAQQLKPTQKAAASDLYGDIDYELAFGDVDQETYEQAEDALALLEERFPGIRRDAHDKIATGRIPNLSRKGKDRAMGEPVAAGESSPTRNGTVAPAATQVPERSQQTAKTRRATWRATRAPRYARQTVRIANQATGGWGSLIMTTILTAGGLAFLYLMVAGKGPQGLARLFSGLSTVLGWIISPTVDPLNPPKGALA